MKKITMVLMIFISMFAFSTCVYAREMDFGFELLQEFDFELEDDDDLLNDFEITGGISHKDMEATFDEYRTITGAAKKDTTVYILVFRLDEDDEFNIIDQQYDLIVGRSGVFSKDVDLKTGENKIVIYGEKDGKISIPVQVIINRKSLDIKYELEGKTIILPGRIRSTS